MSENGEKSKIIWFLLAILQAITLTWIYGVNKSNSESIVKITTLEANYAFIARELGEIKEMVKSGR